MASKQSNVLQEAEATTVAEADEPRGKGAGALMLTMKQQWNEAWRVSHAECSVGTRVGGKGTAADGAALLKMKQQRSEVLRGAIPSVASMRAERARDAASGALI